MATDTVADAVDTLDVTDQTHADASLGAASDKDTTSGKIVMGGKEYASLEEANKAFSNAQAAMTKAQQEAAELRHKVELGDIGVTLAQAVREGLAANAATTQDPARLKQERDELVARLNDGGGDAVVDFTSNFVRTSHEKTKAELIAEIKKRDADLAALKADVTELKETSHPIYRARQAEVQELMEAGMTRAAAIKYLAKKNPAVAPAMDDPSASMAQRRTAGQPVKQVVSDEAVEAEIASIKRIVSNMSAQEEADWRARLKGGRK